MCEVDRFDQEGVLRYRSYLRLLADLQLPAQLRCKVDASDIVQETLLRAYRSETQFRGSNDSEHLAWLRTILTNVLCDEAKRYATGKRDLHKEQSLQANIGDSAARLEELLSDQIASPSETADCHEKLLHLADSLERLADDERQAVHMHHLQGKSLAEIAEVLDRTKPAIASLLYRSLNKLRESMSL